MTAPAPTSLPGGNNRFGSQRYAEASLAPHPYRVELRGKPNDLTWPRICSACGASASEQVVVRKGFRRRRSRRGRGSSSGLSDYQIVSTPVPLCSSCAHTHRATVKKPSAAAALFGFLLHPIIIPVVGAGYFAVIIFKSTRGLSLSDSAGQAGWGLFALMVFIMVWTTVIWFRSTVTQRLEPQTEITRACDFSGNVSQIFERERHIYAMRNEAFARAFEAANAGARWTEADQARSRRLTPIYAGLFLLVLAGIATLLTIYRGVPG